MSDSERERQAERIRRVLEETNRIRQREAEEMHRHQEMVCFIFHW